MTDKEQSLWDQAVVVYELSGIVAPKGSHARQYECHPIEWAAKKLYARMAVSYTHLTLPTKA